MSKEIINVSDNFELFFDNQHWHPSEDFINELSDIIADDKKVFNLNMVIEKYLRPMHKMVCKNNGSDEYFGGDSRLEEKYNAFINQAVSSLDENFGLEVKENIYAVSKYLTNEDAEQKQDRSTLFLEINNCDTIKKIKEIFNLKSVFLNFSSDEIIQDNRDIYDFIINVDSSPEDLELKAYEFSKMMSSASGLNSRLYVQEFTNNNPEPIYVG